jgi:eukaryotic-like serine/threonine-protein kinase
MGEARFGKYRLIAELGHGGMADVFLAVQAGPAGSGFRKLTVIKRLRQNLAEEAEFVAMLVDEARIAARLNHPNVVQTNEVGQVGPHYFISMEYLDGQPMHRIQHRSAQRAKDGSPAIVSKEQQYIVLMDALAGLHHAHELADFDGTPLAIVHRDMTPHNIFVTFAGQVKVVDFGIAKAAGRASETRQGVVKGKVRYMAPEQAVGQHVDRRADLFSMGVILWEIATGRRLWKDKDDLQIVHELVSGNIMASPRAVDPNVPEAMDRICQRALATKPEDRYATAEEFRADLESFLADTGHLVDARRKLAPSICTLFEDKRDEIRAVIEKQLMALDEKASGEFEPVAIQPESNPSTFSMNLTPSSVSSGSLDVTTTGVTNQKTEVYDPKKRRSAFTIATRALLAASVAGVIGVTGLLLTRKTISPAQQTNAARTTVLLKINATPTHARVSVDDGPPRAVPLDVSVPKDDAVHHLKIEADGFVGRVDTVSFANDVAMTVDLRPAEKVASPSDSGKKKTPAAPTVVTIVKTVPAAPTKPTAEPPPATTPTAPPAATPTTTTAAASSAGSKHVLPPKIDNGDPWATK